MIECYRPSLVFVRNQRLGPSYRRSNVSCGLERLRYLLLVVFDHVLCVMVIISVHVAVGGIIVVHVRGDLRVVVYSLAVG